MAADQQTLTAVALLQPAMRPSRAAEQIAVYQTQLRWLKQLVEQQDTAITEHEERYNDLFLDILNGEK